MARQPHRVLAAATAGVGVRSISCGVMPGNRLVNQDSSGFCISSMPISSHCFCPCASILPGAPRCAERR